MDNFHNRELLFLFFQQVIDRARIVGVCGLRLAECMRIRINNFNLDVGVLAILTAKGRKIGLCLCR